MSSSLHAICRLPEELLSMVFVEWLDADHSDLYYRGSGYRILGKFQRPFCLAAVSRKWRRVAISTPELWCYVNVELQRVTPVTQALWSDYLQTCLLRSGVFLLDLDVEGGLEDSVCQSLREFWTVLRTCCSRASAITMDLGISNPPVPALFLACLAQDMPHLEYLALTCSDYGSNYDAQLKITLFPTAPQLWYLSYHDLGLVWPANSTFPNVTKASITTARMTIVELVEIFQRLPNIEDLDVCTLFLSAADTSIDLSVLRCATLRKLAFHTEGFHEHIVRHMDFPNLRSAVFTFNGNPRHAVTSAAAFATFFGHTLRAVGALALNSCGGIGDGLSGYLNSMPRLHSLWLSGSWTSGGSNLLAELSRPDATGAWPCPRLQRITLSAWDIHSVAPRGIALHIATARGPCADPGRRPPRLLQSVRATYSHTSPFDWSSRMGGVDHPDEKSLQTALDRLLCEWDTEDSESGESA